jgi:hypothetical protein
MPRKVSKRALFEAWTERLPTRMEIGGATKNELRLTPTKGAVIRFGRFSGVHIRDR